MDKQTVRDLFREKERDIHGRILRQYDNLKDTSLNDKQKLEVIQKTSLDIVHEELRNLRNSVIFAMEGRVYSNYKVFNPDSKE